MTLVSAVGPVELTPPVLLPALLIPALAIPIRTIPGSPDPCTAVITLVSGSSARTARCRAPRYTQRFLIWLYMSGHYIVEFNLQKSAGNWMWKALAAVIFANVDSYMPRTTFANVDVPVSAKHHVRERGQLSAKHHVRERGQLQSRSQSVSSLCIGFLLSARPMVQALAQCDLAF